MDVSAEELIKYIKANVDNERLSDAEFREVVRTSLKASKEE